MERLIVWLSLVFCVVVFTTARGEDRSQAVPDATLLAFADGGKFKMLYDGRQRPQSVLLHVVYTDYDDNKNSPDPQRFFNPRYKELASKMFSPSCGQTEARSTECCSTTAGRTRTIPGQRRSCCMKRSTASTQTQTNSSKENNMKSHRSLLASILIAFVFGNAGLLPVRAAASQPNVVVIMVDDMGYSDLGCYGSEIETPSIDALAKNGPRFSQFYNTAKCHSSRVSLHSGQYCIAAGDTGLSHAVTSAEVLAHNGYFTAMTGKWHLKKEPTDFGFHCYFGHLSGACKFF